MKQFFLTDVTGSIVQGHDFGSSKVATDYFNQAKIAYPGATFLNLVVLDIALQGSQGEGIEIILGKYSTQLKSELEEKYPQATFSQFDHF